MIISLTYSSVNISKRPEGGACTRHRNAGRVCPPCLGCYVNVYYTQCVSQLSEVSLWGIYVTQSSPKSADILLAVSLRGSRLQWWELGGRERRTERRENKKWRITQKENPENTIIPNKKSEERANKDIEKAIESGKWKGEGDRHDNTQ